jgi:hypothetical protein
MRDRAALIANGKNPWTTFGTEGGTIGGAMIPDLSQAASAGAHTPFMAAGNYGNATPMTTINTITPGVFAGPETLSNDPHGFARQQQQKARGRGRVTTNAAGQRIMKIAFDVLEVILPPDAMEDGLRAYGR